MDKKDKKFNLKGLLFVIVIVNVFLALAAYVIDLFFYGFYPFDNLAIIAQFSSRFFIAVTFI